MAYACFQAALLQNGAHKVRIYNGWQGALQSMEQPGRQAEPVSALRADHVYVVDDDAMVRRFLKKSLDHEGMVARVFESGLEFLSASRSLDPGVILLDVRMPGMDGLQLLEALGPQTELHSILMLSSHGDVSTAVRALQAGAVDFIEKPFSFRLLLSRIRGLQERLNEKAENCLSTASAKDRLDTLTKREREVAEGLVDGQSNKEIARIYGISPRTVEAHRARLMTKLRLSSLADLVRLCILARGSQR